MEEWLVGVFAFTCGAWGCLELMQNGMSKCRSARVPFGHRATETQKGSILCGKVRVGARQKVASQYRDELSVVRSTRGEGKAAPPPVHKKKTTRPWCVAFAGKVHPKNRPTAIGGLQGAVCNCVSSGEIISVCVGNRVLTNTSTVRNLGGRGVV